MDTFHSLSKGEQLVTKRIVNGIKFHKVKMKAKVYWLYSSWLWCEEVVMKNAVHEWEGRFELTAQDCPASKAARYSEDCKDEDGT